MAVFVRVADLGSFAAAAKEFRLSPTMVGKHIRHLEQRLGSLLVNRSTRRQSLTELGRKQLSVEVSQFERVIGAITRVIQTA